MAQRGIADAESYYREIGARTGHSPNSYFDETWYSTIYQDVRGLIARGVYPSGFAHYRAEGFVDRSPHWLFSERFYLSGNPDLTRSRLDEAGFINAYDHYLSAGDAEFRAGHLFFNPELYTAGTERKELPPFAQFVQDGCAAGSQIRLSWYFDPVWYLQTYPQVAAELAAGKYCCALQHYLYNDTPLLFNPAEWFSEDFYASVHVDLQAALENGQFRNGYDHFIQFGVFECRRPHPEIDLAEYFKQVEVQADIQHGLCRDVFEHYVSKSAQGALTKPHDQISEPAAKALFAARARQLRPLFARRRIDFTCHAAPALSVIVVMYNKLDLTLNTLDSLRRNFAGDIELLLVDSGSADGSRHVERYLTGARLLRFNHNIGYVEACNAALMQATAPVTLFMNNDILLERHAVEAALARLQTNPAIGAVGAKVVRANGLLQEAGCIIWRDGSTQGYLRDGDPNLPEANFVRETDFCSAVFLACRTALLRQSGGFDARYRPAYFEDTDLCVRIFEAGYKIIYDPAIMITHQEYSSGDARTSAAMIARNQPKFRSKNLDYLRTKYPQNPELLVHARSPRTLGRKILFIEDRIPLRHLGSGFTRSNDIIRTMAALGHHVTVFPIYRAVESILDIYRDFSDNVEIIHDRELPDLAAFLEQRSGYYDVLWIARTHNAARLLDILMRESPHLPINRIILDTEAVAASREHRRNLLRAAPEPEPLDKAVRQELASAYFCQKILAVNALDAATISNAGFSNAGILGHVQSLAPTPRKFEDRRGVLFLGAIHDQDSPNLDGLEWFAANVLPVLDVTLPEDVPVSIAGYVNRRIDLSHLGRVRRVDMLGPVDDLAPLYDRHRLFFAPTRYAGGIPYKLHEAASYGLPVVASELLCRQVGWRDDVELLSGGADDPQHFASQILKLYNDAALWDRLRNTALERLAAENSEDVYRQRVAEILAEVCARA
jgi:GT2 family glycosyltransferase